MIFYVTFILFIGVILFFANVKTFILNYTLRLGIFNYSLILLCDKVAWTSTGLIVLVSLIVFKFTDLYMEGDIFKDRFFYLLWTFVLSMIIVVMAYRLPMLLIGWDILGITSFLIILYYYQISNFRRAIITYTVNRIGDALIISSLLYFSLAGSLNFGKLVGFLGLGLTIAAFTKSAGYPFRVWLPLAIDAPTPVRALVHSSTLVTAGFFIIRKFDFHSCNPLTYVGVLTFFLGSLSASYVHDLKKIIAMSTLANLGLIMIVTGLGNFDIIIFHLFSHALFKAPLFLIAGLILMDRFGSQDSRRLPSLASPFLSVLVTYFTFSSLAIFSFSTYFSKHGIIAGLQMECLRPLTLPFLILGLIFRFFYTFRLITQLLGNTALGVRSSAVSRKVQWTLSQAAFFSLALGNFLSTRLIFEFSFSTPSLPLVRLIFICLIISGYWTSFGGAFFYLNSAIDISTNLSKFKDSSFWRLKW